VIIGTDGRSPQIQRERKTEGKRSEKVLWNQRGLRRNLVDRSDRETEQRTGFCTGERGGVSSENGGKGYGKSTPRTGERGVTQNLKRHMRGGRVMRPKGKKKRKKRFHCGLEWMVTCQ